MPLITAKAHSPLFLAARGPILPVRIFLPDVVAKLRNAEPFIIGKGLVDTGASKTCISKRVATELELKSVGTIKVGGVGGANEHSLCHVKFDLGIEVQSAGDNNAVPSFQRMIAIDDCEVIEADIDSQGIVMLIGRDVLAVSALTYDGPTGIWTLEIPRTQPPGQVTPTAIPPIVRTTGGDDSRRAVVGSREKAKAARKAAKKARKKNR